MRSASFIPVGLLLTLTVTACDRTAEADAYGNFEADEVVLAAETAGPLLQLAVAEGDSVAAGQVLAVVDTIPLALDRQQLLAQRQVLVARRREAGTQRTSVAAQLEIAERSLARTTRLREGDAATAQQADAAEREVSGLRGQRDALDAAQDALGAELTSVDAKLASLADRQRRAIVRAPTAGTVLATYVRVGETVQPGQALVALADLRTLTLRAYLTGDQLGQVRLGAPVTVRVTIGNELVGLAGTVSWIAARAEFTPTPVQTRDERADLVYAMKVRVSDAEGRLKIGMPADVTFAAAP